MTRKTVLFFCCFAVLTAAPAWGETKVLYSCKRGYYAKVASSTDAKCSTGFSLWSSDKEGGKGQPVYTGSCAKCPDAFFDEKKATKARLYTNTSRYHPAVKKNCYMQGGTTEYTDEAGTFTMSSNCYYGLSQN